MFEERNQGERTLRRGLEYAYWLIEKVEDGPMEVLTTDLGGGQRALPVFSHREEAELFLWLGRLMDSWRARKSEGREISRVLSDRCARSIDFVVLDPLPEMLAERTLGLVSLTRESFTLQLMRPPGYTLEGRDGERAELIREAGYGSLLP